MKTQVPVSTSTGTSTLLSTKSRTAPVVSTERTLLSKGTVVTTLTSNVNDIKTISLGDLDHSVWTHQDHIKLLGYLAEFYDINTDETLWCEVCSKKRMNREINAVKKKLSRIKELNPTMKMTELIDPSNIGKIKFRKTDFSTLHGTRTTFSQEETLEMVVTIREQRKLNPPNCNNIKRVVEYFTQQNNGVQKFGGGFARNLIKMASGKEVTPPKTKFGTTKSKRFIKHKMKDADFNLLDGSDPFLMSAEELQELMTNTPFVFHPPHKLEGL